MQTTKLSIPGFSKKDPAKKRKKLNEGEKNQEKITQK